MVGHTHGGASGCAAAVCQCPDHSARMLRAEQNWKWAETSSNSAPPFFYCNEHALLAAWAEDVLFRGRVTRRRTLVFGVTLAGALGPLVAGVRNGQSQVAAPQQALGIAISVVAASADLDDRAHEMAELITKDLRTTARFAPLDPATWRAIDVKIDAVPQFEVWRSLGVRALAIGHMRTTGERLGSGFRLWDVERGQALYGQFYVSPLEEWRWVAHITASLICERLIGEKRDFEATHN